MEAEKRSPGSRREERMRGSARLIRLHDDDGSFGREFWASIPAQRRLEMMWDIVLEYCAWRGIDQAQLKMDRSMRRVRRLHDTER